MVLGQAQQQMRSQPETPDPHQEREDRASRRPAPADHRVEPGQQAEGVGPDNIHEAVVVEPAADPKCAGEEEGKAGQRVRG